MIPPNKSHLKALAGWAISARLPQCSDQQHNCLRRFQDSCGELAELVEDLPNYKKPEQKVAAVDRLKEPKSRGPVLKYTIPIDAQEAMGVKQEGPCKHRFSIKTQHCMYCGTSYREAHGRDPELF